MLALEELFPFALDDFQLEAIAAIDGEKNVIVCAPTGSGKTAIAEYAIHRALQTGRRCFYTTPLKALSNQKFQDFRAQFGEERVGLLTGDISLHRNASIVVMTTEVFRNMLYGTTLGEVERNLYGVSTVVLDECHYMNDVERGTVWEESIIYAPQSLQLVALSATIANARELRDWVTHTHRETVLVSSDYRPVPLQHHFFHRRNLMPMFAAGGRVDPRLKRILAGSLVKRGRRGGRPGRSERSQQSPESVDDVVRSLERQDMLPAIYFVFSRRGCEQALQACRGALPLRGPHRRELDAAVASFCQDNPSIEGNPHYPALLEGLAVHHAGLLPAWKTLVEQLFQRGLIKVVFATETLAAGINMPARTTVISTISKYSGDGHRLLTASEFLQMSGRAGRRGMDEVGHVVIVSHPKESPQAAISLARSPADPLESNFRPSYGMVLNLLQNHTPAQCRNLVERSFGQFLADQGQSHIDRERARLEARWQELSRPLCPGPQGDLGRYRKWSEKYQTMLRQSRSMRGQAAQLQTHLDRLRENREQLRVQMESSPCHECPVMKPCSRQLAEQGELERQLRRLRPKPRANTPYWPQFQALSKVLEQFGYLEQNRPTARGELAAYLRATNVLFLAEVAHSGCLERLTPSQTAAALASLVSDDSRPGEPNRRHPSPAVREALEAVYTIAEQILRAQMRQQVEVPIVVQPNFGLLAERWAEGDEWNDLIQSSGLEAGDLVRALRRTLDICRQLAWAPGTSPHLSAACKATEKLISRDELRESLLIMDSVVE